MILGHIDKNISTKHSATVTKIVLPARKEWHKVERHLLIAWNYSVNLLNLKKYVWNPNWASNNRWPKSNHNFFQGFQGEIGKITCWIVREVGTGSLSSRLTCGSRRGFRRCCFEYNLITCYINSNGYHPYCMVWYYVTMDFLRFAVWMTLIMFCN